MLTDADLARLVQSFYATVLERENQLRLLGRMSIDEETRQAKVKHYTEVAERTRRDLAANNFSSADAIAATMIHKHGLTAKLGDVEVRQVQQAMLRAGCDLAEAVKARFEGDFSYEPRDNLLKLELAKAEGALAPIEPEAEQPAPPSQQPSPGFVARAEEFRLSQGRRSVWDPQTALQARKTYQLFAEFSGDRPIGGYVRADAVQFKDMLCELPANYGKAAKYRGMTGASIVAATKDQDLPRLSSRTVQRHLSVLSALWVSAVEQGEASGNIFTGFKLPSSRKPQDQRDMWSIDKLKCPSSEHLAKIAV